MKKAGVIFIVACTFFSFFNASAADSGEFIMEVPRAGLRKITSPDCAHIFFCQAEPGQMGFIGMKNDHGFLLWRRSIGINTFLRPTWSEDGLFIGILTDYGYNNADLHSPSFGIRNFLYILEASTGRVVDKRDIDQELFKHEVDASLRGRPHDISLIIEKEFVTASTCVNGQRFSSVFRLK